MKFYRKSGEVFLRPQDNKRKDFKSLTGNIIRWPISLTSMSMIEGVVGGRKRRSFVLLGLGGGDGGARRKELSLALAEGAWAQWLLSGAMIGSSPRELNSRSARRLAPANEANEAYSNDRRRK